jgi:hypothetical protein
MALLDPTTRTLVVGSYSGSGKTGAASQLRFGKDTISSWCP